VKIILLNAWEINSERKYEENWKDKGRKNSERKEKALQIEAQREREREEAIQREKDRLVMEEREKAFAMQSIFFKKILH